MNLRLINTESVNFEKLSVEGREVGGGNNFEGKGIIRYSYLYLEVCAAGGSVEPTRGRIKLQKSGSADAATMRAL